MSHSFALLVPVKALTAAKSRLALAGSGQGEELMRAFALDAIAAASRSAAVARVYVVTDEPGFEAEGAVRIPDEGEGDLNRALRRAAGRVRLLDPTLRLAAMCADLPSLTHDDLDVALSAGTTKRWFVADAAGTGTTLLATEPGGDLDPHFGTESARRHEESGASPVRATLATLRMDVDTEEDLRRAVILGVGIHTAAALRARSR